ncbi:hypothetical protein GGR88_000827 [Sphingomonas jejuensis]|uniref:Ice-binding protein C-terminal domain-containing protein n=1 Tax=Sphingomonas jejuensis TaxID=904715 RepID=A0ABX0XJL2_9SPHN|nr:PEPxxWA-CTERM sorting domain-containing protein [Sphingomonas jejuensis]NJC33353.1 hypothetical protein [Sphingomonas jejuensis]
MIRTIALAATLLASATSANAAVTITRVGDAYSNANGGQNIIFRNDFNTSQEQSQVTGTGFLFRNVTDQFGAMPAPGNPSGSTANQYLSVLGGGTATLAINPALNINSFMIDIGSIDSYNDLTITFNGAASQTFTGGQLLALSGIQGPANGDQVSSRTNGRFMFAGVQGFSSVTFASGQNSFEIDNFRAAVPEPATWAMMIAGFGMVGAGMRRRRASGQVAFA